MKIHPEGCVRSAIKDAVRGVPSDLPWLATDRTTIAFVVSSEIGRTVVEMREWPGDFIVPPFDVAVFRATI